jgi:hypothetical protein
VILLTTLVAAASASAQDAPLPPAPVAVTPPLSPPGALGRPVPATPPSPLTYTPAPPPSVFPPAPAIDPGPDGWGPYGHSSAPPGWFFSTETAVVFPSIKFNVKNDQPLPLTGLQLNVPDVALDTAIMPTLELGYQLGDSCGFFAFSYSFLFTEGDGSRDTVFGPAAVRTRLEINWFDLDYGTDPFEFWPRWEINWRIGARIADVFFDSRADSGGITQTVSNDFFGAGPHARLDVERRIVPLPGLALFGRVDGAAFIGRVEQRYSLQFAGTNDTAMARRNQLVPYLNLQAGLSYAPPSLPGLKFTAGYLFEDYFNVGRLGVDSMGGVSDSRGEVWSHGWFLRGLYAF